MPGEYQDSPLFQGPALLGAGRVLVLRQIAKTLTEIRQVTKRRHLTCILGRGTDFADGVCKIFKGGNARKNDGAPHQSPAKTWLQIFGELFNEGPSAFRLLPLLFGLHDTASALLVGGHDERVYASSGNVSGSLKQRDNIVTNFVLSRWWPYSNPHSIRQASRSEQAPPIRQAKA